MPENGYPATPLTKKLGIRPGARLALVNPPVGFLAELDPLPAGVEIKSLGATELDVVVLFTKSSAELAERLPRAAARLAAPGGLWIGWPRDKGLTDLNSQTVQATGLGAGLVDNKVAKFNESWTGMRFVVRIEDRPNWNR
jgi:hypothetical protein